MKLKAILIDDERKALVILKHKIEQFCPEIEIIGETQSPTEGLKLIMELQPELVFLDIAMPQISGFDLLAQIKDPDFEIIFVTAFDDYAIDAVNNCAIGYLLKPIDNVDLVQAVDRALKNVNGKDAILRSQTLIENLKSKSLNDSKIAIPSQNGLEFIRISDIVHCQGEKGYTKLFLNKNRTILSSYNIGYFSKQLIRLNFFLVHKSHLINLDCVSKFLNEGYVVLSDGSRIPVSRSRKSAFLERIL